MNSFSTCRLRLLSVFSTMGLLLLLVPAGNAQLSDSFGAENPLDKLVNEPIIPIPLDIDLDSNKVLLGKRLFNDPRLSRNDSVSCNSCHDLANGGTDHLSHPVGPDATSGDINTLTVFNSANNFVLFWDGRAESLEDQLDSAMQSPRKMGLNWDGLISKLEKDSDYVNTFTQIYPQGITVKTVKDAIATFERSLVTPNSRFDQYLRGDTTAITDDEKHGYQLFKSYGCVACHQGMNVGGNMFQIFGVMSDYFADRGEITKADLGRFNVTGLNSDRHRFRVPSLRNVARTSPYFHDGSADTLEQAIMVMARYQLGRTIPVDDVNYIAMFLRTLSGEYDGNPL